MTNPAVGNSEAWRSLMLEEVERLLVKTSDAGYSLREREGVDFLIDQAINWDLSIRDPRIEIYIKRYFWREIQRLTGEDMDYVFDHVEAVFEERKQQKHDRIISDALLESIELATRGGYNEVKQKIQEAVTDAESVLAERPVQPVRNVSEWMPDLRLRLQRLQGVRHTGFVQKTLPELDDATDGIQGLTLINAKSNEGKTNLCLQVLLDVLGHRDDVCALFVSLDMVGSKSLGRMVSNRSMLPLRVVESGSGDNGWTEQEAAQVEKGIRDVERLGHRMRILDRFCFPYAGRTQIRKEAANLMDATGCDNIIILVDFLQKLPVPQSLKDPTQQDEYRIDGCRDVADELGESGALLVITESNKSDKNYERGASENVKGSNRIVMSADCIINLTAFSAEELTMHYEINNDWVSPRQSREPPQLKPPEMLRNAIKIRKGLAARGQAPVLLTVSKARDRARRADFNVLHHFECNAFTSLK